MRLLLDTHVLVWLATDRRQLNRRELEAIHHPAAELFLSSFSLWELRIKLRAERRRNRLGLKLDPAGAAAFCAEAKIVIEEVSAADILAPPLMVELPHGDPLDEMLLIHAQRPGARLLTRDRKLLGHPLALQL